MNTVCEIGLLCDLHVSCRYRHVRIYVDIGSINMLRILKEIFIKALHIMVIVVYCSGSGSGSCSGLYSEGFA